MGNDGAELRGDQSVRSVEVEEGIGAVEIALDEGVVAILMIWVPLYPEAGAEESH